MWTAQGVEVQGEYWALADLLAKVHPSEDHQLRGQFLEVVAEGFVAIS
jgi:hypothetical protein